MFLLLLGLTSAKSRPHVQLIRAEHPSNGSSEPLSESLSKLSSHQIPRCLRVPLQLKGCTGSPTLSSSTTPSGASVLQVHSALQHSTSASGPFRRVPPPRGFPPRCPSRAFPSSSGSSLSFCLYEALPHSEVRRRWTLVQERSTLPSLLCTWTFFRSPMRVMEWLPGQTDVFPVCGSTSTLAIALCISSLLWMSSAGMQSSGAVERVSPTAFEYMHVVTSEYLCNFTALVNDVRMHFHLVSF